MAELKGTQDPPEPEGRVRRRVAGEPPLPLLREGRRRRGLPRDRRQLPRHRRRRDRPRARPPRLPEAGRRSGDRTCRSATPRRTSRPPSPARRTSTRHVPGHGEDRARGGLRRHRRLVRDAREGREVARRPLREDARAIADRRSRTARRDPQGVARSAVTGRAEARPTTRHDATLRAHLVPARPTGSPTTRPSRSTGTRRRSSKEIAARLRDLPRLPHVLQVLRHASRRCSTLLDEQHDGDVRRLDAGRDATRVMDACFQCKLCEVQCPYTPRDGHEFQLDFPKLVHRYAAQRTRARAASRCAIACSAIPTCAGRSARASPRPRERR